MTHGTASIAESLALLPASDREAIIQDLTPTEAQALEYDWRFWARPNQLPPEGDWLTWVLRAGRGFGKTRSGAGWVQRRATELRRWICLFARNPADARDYMVEGPGGIRTNAPPHERPEFIPSRRTLRWPNGSYATIYSSEDPDQSRGFSGDTAWFDEFAKWKNPRECWDNVQFGMREASIDHPRICISTTPKPLPILEEIEEDADTVVTVGSSYDNRGNLSPVWFDKTLAKYEGTELGRQEIHAELLDMVEGRVYSSFNKAPFPDGNIDASVADLGAEIYVGQDFNVNPMASVIAVRAVDECHVIDALEIPVSNTDEVAGEIKRRYPNRKVIFCPDPSGNSRKTSAKRGVTDFTILRAAGFEVRAPNAAPVVVDRVNNTIAMLRQKDRRRVRIHPRAKPLIRALGGLTYKEGTSIRDKASGYDHICFAKGTPIMTAYGEVPIEDVRVGDMVLTRFGLFPVSVSTETCPEAELREVEMTNGRRVLVTPDHPFWVKGEGFVPLRGLTRSATLFVCESTNGIGSQQTARYHRDTISTMSMGTGRTAPFPTWNANSGQNTCAVTGPSTGKDAPLSYYRTSNGLDSLPLNGTAQKRAGRGIASTAGERGRIANPSRSLACGVETGRWFSSSAGNVISAPRSARPPNGVHREWTKRTGCAPSVGIRSASIGIKKHGLVRGVAGHILAIRPASSAPVYNLSVDGPHEYFAAGVLVSNCDALDYLLWQEFNVLAREVLRVRTVRM